MSDLATTSPVKRAQTPAWVWLLLTLVAAVFLAANAHLIYVAAISQPACIEHLRQGHGDLDRGRFAAAQSSCSPLPTERTGSP
jgi:hypothetical protein